MADPRIFDDPDFRALPRASQRKLFAELEPDFAGLSEASQDSFLEERTASRNPMGQFGEDLLQTFTPEGASDVGRSARAGLQASLAGLDQTAANAVMLARKGGQFLQAGQVGEPSNLETHLGERAAELGERAMQSRPERQTSIAKVVEGTSALPVGLLTAVAAAKLGGPVAGFAGLGALGAAHEGLGPALLEGAKGAAIGKVFQATEGAAPYVRAPAVGAATYALSNEEDPVRLGTEVATMAGLSALGPAGRRLPQHEIVRQMETRAAEVRARVEEPPGVTAPQPEPPAAAPIAQPPATEPPRPVEPPVAPPAAPPVAPAPVPAPTPTPRGAEPAPTAPVVAPPPVEAPPVAAPATAPTPPVKPAVRPPVGVGRDAPIRVEGRDPLGSRYELVELSDVVASHDSTSFAPRPEYRGAQERDYQGDKNEQGKVIGRADTFDAREVLNDSPNATSGPPIVDAEGNVFGGNGRTMMMERVYGGKAKYAAEQLKQEVVGAAERFGLDSKAAAGMERPVIIRRLADVPKDANGRLNLSRILNIDPSYKTTATARAQSQAAALRQAAEAFTEAVERAPKDLPTIRDAISSGEAGRKFARALQDDGIIPANETAQWLTPEGVLTRYGLDQAEQILLARIIPDLRLIESMPAALREKMLRTVPLAMRVESVKEGALAPLLVGVVRSEIARQASGMNVEEFSKQIPLGTAEAAPSQLSPRIAKLHKLFVEAKPNEIRAKLAEVARGIEDTAAGQMGLLTGKVPTVDDAFTAADLSRIPKVGETRGNWAEPEADRAGAAGPPGPTYVGFRDFTPQNIDVPLPKKIVSAGDALERLARALKIPVQQGNLRSLQREKGVLGFARSNLSSLSPRRRAKANLALRVRKWGDIQTSTHEMAHILDNRTPAFTKWYDWRLLRGNQQPTQAQLEVAGVSYDISKPYEGFAEFMRHWFTQREVLEGSAPVALREFEAMLPKVLSKGEVNAMRRAQKEMHAYFEQGARAAARTVIGPNNRAGEALSTELDRLRAVSVDRFHGIRMADQIVKGGDSTAPDRVWSTFKELDRISSLEEGLIANGAPKWEGPAGPTTPIRFIGKGVADILGPVSRSKQSLHDFYHYAFARMSEIARQHGIETPYTEEMIRDGFARATPEQKRAYSELAHLRDGVLEFAIESGQFSREQAREWRFRGQMAWSLMREVGLPHQGAGGMNQLLQERGVHHMKGSSRNFVEPIEAILGGSGKLIRLSMENLAKRQLYEDVLKAPGGGRIGEHIPAEKLPQSVSAKAIEEAITANVEQALGVGPLPKGWLSNDPAMNQFIQLWIGGQPPRDTMQRVYSFRQNGKPVYFEIFDPVLAYSLSSMRKEAAGDVLRILGAIPRRVEQAMITVHPKFLWRQMIRDPIMAMVHSRTGASGVGSSMRGWVEAARIESELVKQMQANLGAGSEFRHRDVPSTEKEIIRRARRAGATTLPQKAKVAMLDISNPKNYVRALQALGRGIERGPRLGEARRSLAQGENARIAARRYADVTTDFAGEGGGRIIDQGASRAERTLAAWTKFAVHTAPFYRAQINSMEKLYRDGVNSEGWRGRVAAKFAIVALTQVALHAMLRDDEDYADIPEEIKNANVYLGKVDLGGQGRREDMTWLTLPSTYEIGMVARIISRTMDEALSSGDPDRVKYATDLMEIAAQTFGVNLPTIPGVALEQLSGRTSMGFPIESQGQQQLKDWYRTGPGVPASLEEAGRLQRHLPEGVPKLSPARANALLRSFFGNWTGVGFGVVDWALFPERGLETRWTEKEFAPPFLQRVGKYSQAERDFYALAEGIHQTVSTMRAGVKRDDQEVALEMLRDPRFAAKGIISRGEKIIADLRNQAEGAKRDTKLTPKQKREKVEALRAEIVRLERLYIGMVGDLSRAAGGSK